jgi:peptidyl-prolyl cis-trans isomerase D
LVIIALSWYVFANWGAGGRLGAPSSVVAKVDGDEILFKEYVKAYKSIQEYYKRLYGDRYNSNLEKFLNIKESAVSNLIDERVISREAKMMGIYASPVEIADAIRENPRYSDGKGHYVGDERLKQYLRSQGIDIKDFEKDIEGQVIYNKYSNVIQQSVFATTDELRKEYKEKNEKVAFDYVLFKATDYLEQAGQSVTEEQAKEYYDKNKEEFKTPLKRKIAYVLFNPTLFEKDIKVSENEIKKYYNDNIDKYTVKEQVKAEHILIGTRNPKRTDAEAKKLIQKIQSELKKGKKFEDLAKKYSDDKASAVKGGDLGFFTRDKMVKQFSDAAFALKKGEISEPVKSTYGYHIIKVTDRIEGKVDSLESVKKQILSLLTLRKARKKAADLAKAFYEKVEESKEFEQNAKDKNLELKMTDFFPNDPLYNIKGLGPNRLVADTAFSLNINDVSSPVFISEGYIVFKLIDEKAPSIPKFEEIKDKVIAKVKKNIAEELAKKKAIDFKVKVTPKTFAKVAKKNKLEVKSVAKINRQGSGMIFSKGSDSFEKIFSYQKDQITDALKDSNGNYVICIITDKDNIDNKAFLAQIQKQRGEMLKRKASKLLNSTIQNARKALEDRGKIWINPKFYEHANTP